MRILFDQAVPLPLRPYLVNHSIRTAAEEGWDRLRNGDLLTAAENAGFDLLLTTDQNMQYQQNLDGRKIGVLVLSRQQWPHLKPHVQLVVDAVSIAMRGAFNRVDIPETIP
jgi:hypothetical protein